MENKNKCLTFIGFAVKARKIRIGVNAISTLKRGVMLLIVCNTASENTLNDAYKLSKRFNCKLLISNFKLEDATYKLNSKLVAITDKALACAIYENKGEMLTEYIREAN